MIYKLKVKSVKCRVSRHYLKTRAGTQSLKFFVLSFGFSLFALNFALITAGAYAQPVSSTELINNAKEYDGKVVIYSGEVIGDVMARGEFAWINIKDDKNAIGIWITKDLTKEILYTGSYKSKGDWVEIVGVFQRACKEHGADLDIHAQEIRKISSGAITSQNLNPNKRNLVYVLLGALCLSLILRRLKTR
jgi:hypothetical protein